MDFLLVSALQLCKGPVWTFCEHCWKLFIHHLHQVPDAGQCWNRNKFGCLSEYFLQVRSFTEYKQFPLYVISFKCNIQKLSNLHVGTTATTIFWVLFFIFCIYVFSKSHVKFLCYCHHSTIILLTAVLGIFSSYRGTKFKSINLSTF